MTETTVTPITHLDEDWAVPCQRYPVHLLPPCDAIAEWIAWSVRCCPDRAAALALCVDHKDELLTGDYGECVYCGEQFAPVRVGFRLIEPLNRRTT